MKNRIKTICFILNGSRFSGAEKRTLLTAARLSECNLYRIDLIITSTLYKKIENHSGIISGSFQNVHVSIVQKSQFKSVFLRKIKNFLMQYYYFLKLIPSKDAIVHVCLYNSFIISTLVLPILLFRKNRFIFEVTSPDVADSFATRLLLQFSSMHDGLFCVSRSVFQRVIEKVEKLKSSSVVFQRKNPFVDVQTISLSQIAKKKNIVVFAHRLIERKNPELVAEVFGKMAQKHADWEFAIYGDGPLRSKIADICASFRCPNFKFEGYANGMLPILTESKIFVSVISPDNFPSQSTLEAMATGNALLLSEGGETRIRFFDGTNGRMVSVTHDSLLSGLGLLIEESEIDEMCRNSVGLFSKNFSIANYIDESFEVYAQLSR